MTSPLLTGSLQNSSLAPIVPPSVGKVAGGGGWRRGEGVGVGMGGEDEGRREGVEGKEGGREGRGEERMKGRGG